MHYHCRSQRRRAGFVSDARVALSLLKSARAKARTAASLAAPSHSVPDHAKLLLAAATQGEATGLKGGLPIKVNGMLLGGIGIGSGSGEQDEDVARAALSAIGAELS